MSIGVSRSSHAIVNRVSLARCVFRFLELDEVNLVDFTNYSFLLDILVNLQADPQRETDLLFSMCDMDGDQELSRDEFKQLLILFFGRSPTGISLGQIWNELHDPASGRIRRESYIQWLTNGSQKLLKGRPSTVQIVGANMKAFDAYIATKGLVGEKDTRQPWYHRHHIPNM